MKLLAAVLMFVSQLAFAAVSAPSYLIMDMDGKVLLEKNADDVRPIASITKLLISKYVRDQDPDELLEVIKEDMRTGRMRSTLLKVGQKYPRRLLLELSLVASDNVAAITLGRNLPEGLDLPVSEWSGLDPHNQLSARQLADLARELYQSDVATTSVQPSVKVGKNERRSTNPILNSQGWHFYLSKTGFIDASGGCLLVITEMAGQTVTAVILGSKDTRSRWRDLAELRREVGDDTDYAEPKFAVPRAVKKKRTRR